MTGRMSSIVTPAAPDEFPALVRVLADAMLDDPGWAQVFPDRDHRLLVWESLGRAALAQAGPAGGTIFVARRGSTPIGVAIGLPPGSMPLSFDNYVRGVVQLAPFAARHPRSTAKTVRLLNGMEKPFPTDRVWYLQWLGVAPSAQRQGAGHALLDAFLAEGERYGCDAYLETQNPDNVAYYEGYGFADLYGGQPVYRGGPLSWYMRRSRSASGRRTE